MNPRSSCITTLVDLLRENKSCLFVCFPGYENRRIVERVRRCLGPEKRIRVYPPGRLTPENLHLIRANTRGDSGNMPCLALVEWNSLRDMLTSDEAHPYVITAFDMVVCQNPHVGELDALSEENRHMTRLTGGHPVLAARVKSLQSRYGKHGLEGRMAQDKIAREQMDQMIEFLDDTETGILKKLGSGKGKGLNREERDIAQHWLCTLGLIRHEGNDYRIFSSAFQKYLQSTESSYGLRGFVRRMWSHVSSYSNSFLILLVGAIGIALLWLLGIGTFDLSVGTFGLSAVLLASLVLLGRLVRRLVAASTDTLSSNVVTHEAIADNPKEAVRKGLLQELWALIEQTLILPPDIKVPMWIVLLPLVVCTSKLVYDYFEIWDSVETVHAASVFPGVLSKEDDFRIEFPRAAASNDTLEIKLHPSNSIVYHYQLILTNTSYVYQYEYQANCDSLRVLRPGCSACTIKLWTSNHDRSNRYPTSLPVTIRLSLVGRHGIEPQAISPPEETQIHNTLPGTVLPIGSKDQISKRRPWAFGLVILSEAVLVMSSASYVHRHMNTGRHASRPFGFRWKQKKPLHASGNSRLREVWKEYLDRGRIVSCVEVGGSHSRHANESR